MLVTPYVVVAPTERSETNAYCGFSAPPPGGRGRLVLVAGHIVTPGQDVWVSQDDGRSWVPEDEDYWGFQTHRDVITDIAR